MNRPILLSELNDKARYRFADIDDILELLKLYERFYEEASYKDFLDLDLKRVEDTITFGISANVRPHILVFVGERMVGFISWVLDHTFSVKPCQILQELYVLPAYRRSALGRGLVGLSILEGRHAGAGAYHAPVASGMVEQKTLFNLFSKAGFEQCGFMLRRKL